MLVGSVDNGEKVDVQVGGWIGRGAIKRDRGRVELVYLGPPPERFPATVVIDGQDAKALSKAKHRDAAPFTVLVLDRD